MSFFQGPASSILHPTDFSAASESAFAHALAIALGNKADLTLMHVATDANQEDLWHEFPSVRKTLVRWGKLPRGAHRSDVEDKLGIYVKKMISVDKNVANSIVESTEFDSFDLLVMGTHEHKGHSLWSKPSVSVPVSVRTHLPTLFVPEGVRGCVDMQTGETRLKRIVVAVDHQPNAQPAVSRTALSLQKFGATECQIDLLHVGVEGKFPLLDPPERESLTWSTITRQGTPSVEIVSQAQEADTDLIVMVVEGNQTIWDAIVGSTLQNVLKKAPCPVLTVPAG